MVDARDTLSILSSQGSGCGHGIAPMSSNHFLISFESAVVVLAMNRTLRKGSRLTLLRSYLSQQ